MTPVIPILLIFFHQSYCNLSPYTNPYFPNINYSSTDANPPSLVNFSSINENLQLSNNSPGDEENIPDDIDGNFIKISFAGHQIKVPEILKCIFITLPQIPNLNPYRKQSFNFYCPASIGVFAEVLRIIEVGKGDFCKCQRCENCYRKIIPSFLTQVSKFGISEVIAQWTNSEQFQEAVRKGNHYQKQVFPCGYVQEWKRMNVLYPILPEQLQRRILRELSYDNRIKIPNSQFVVYSFPIDILTCVVGRVIRRFGLSFTNKATNRYALPIGVTDEYKPVYSSWYFKQPLNLLAYITENPIKPRKIVVGVNILHLQIKNMHHAGFVFGALDISTVVFNLLQNKNKPKNMKIDGKIVIFVSLRCFVSDTSRKQPKLAMIQDWKFFIAFCRVLIDFLTRTWLPFQLENLEALAKIDVDSYHDDYESLCDDIKTLAKFNFQ